MSKLKRCPECGAALPAGVLAGMCPRCLLAAGIGSGDEAQQASGGTGSEVPTSPHPGGFVPPDPASLAAHFPQLEILELLGCGGMGAVYKARQTRLDRLVALKIIRPESADTSSFAERFNREARLLARLSHAHIVAVHDFGDVDISLREMTPHAEREDYTRTLYYFLMEYVDGTNLRQLLEAGELTPQQALAIVPQICDALQYAHDEGIIHRDIKPENILLDRRGRVKIADFGLARLAARSAEEITLTGTHQVMGTPRYMAPEQMEGSHAVDHRADIYSLGVVFYEMLTGEVPAGHFEPPSRKVQVDVQLDEVVLRALAREPERRYQRVSELKTDVESLSNIASSAPLRSTGEGAPVDGDRGFAARGPFVLWLMTSLLGLAVAAAGVAVPLVPAWAQVYNSASSTWHVATGFDWWQGMLVCFSFVGAALAVFATVPWRQIPLWRPMLLALAGMTATVGAGSFVVQLTNGTLPVQPLLNAASWAMSIDGKIPATVREAKVVTQVEPGPYVAMGLAVALLVLAAVDSAGMRLRDSAHHGVTRPVAAKPFPWTAFWIGIGSLASVLSLIAFAMYWTSSPWPLLGIALPWFLAGAIFGIAGGGDKEMAGIAPAVLVHLGVTFLASVALVAYAIVLIDSAQPLWMVALCGAAIFTGGVIGYGAATDEESDSTSDADSGAESEGPQDEAVAANRGGDVPGGPMILVGTIATITLVSSGGDDLLAWLRGGSPSFDSQWQFLLGGPLVVLGGMAMLQRRGYWLAIGASLACLPLGLGSENVVVRLIPLALGLYSLYLLMQPEVREAFGFAGGSQPDAPAAVAVGPQPSPSERGMIGRAWDEWWAERDRWFTRAVLTALLIVHVACFAMFTALRGGGGYEDGRAFAWHHVGWPSPWFVYELGKEPNVYFQRKLNFLASSMLIAAVGMLAWYAFWRIQLVRDASHARLWRTIGSPTAIFILWALAGAALATFGANDAERLYESMRTTNAPAGSRQSGDTAAEAAPSG